MSNAKLINRLAKHYSDISCVVPLKCDYSVDSIWKLYYKNPKMFFNRAYCIMKYMMYIVYMYEIQINKNELNKTKKLIRQNIKSIQ